MIHCYTTQCYSLDENGVASDHRSTWYAVLDSETGEWFGVMGNGRTFASNFLQDDLSNLSNSSWREIPNFCPLVYLICAGCDSIVADDYLCQECRRGS